MVADRERSQIRATLKAAFQDAAQYLIDQGVTAKEFNAVLAEVFVEAAQSRARLKNGKINQSRVAIITGYTRTEIRKILTKQRSTVLESRTFGANRVLDGWSRDPEFSTRTGERKPLPINGEYGSFVRLARKYSGDIPAKATLDELSRINAVRTRNGIVSTIKASVTTGRQRTASLQRMSGQMADLFRSMGREAAGANVSTAVDSVTFEFLDDVALRIAEERAKQNARAFMNGLETALRTLIIEKSNKSAAKRKKLTLSLTISKTK
jgi:hypothetical protein